LKLFLGDDLLEFHQAVVSTLRDADDVPIPIDPAPMIPHMSHSVHNAMNMNMLPPMNDDLGRISDTINTDQDPEDDLDPGKIRCGRCFDGDLNVLNSVDQCLVYPDSKLSKTHACTFISNKHGNQLLANLQNFVKK
jgi:hypothetical protein